MIRLFNLVSLLFVPLVLSAKPKPITSEEMIKHEDRPTIQETLNLEDGPSSSEVNNSTSGEAWNWRKWTNLIERDAPALIAALEHAYPGAKWAFIGRDVSAIADVLEAFYTYIGQKDRVVRLGVSKASFQNASDKDLLKFLETHGFSLDGFEKRSPFVLVDTMSTGAVVNDVHVSGRQGRALLDVVYRKHKKDGGDVAELVKRFNFVGIIVSTYHGQEHSTEFSETIKKYQQLRLSLAPPEDFQTGLNVMTWRDGGQKFGEVGYVHFTGAWHDSYGKIRKSDDGDYTAKVGKQFDEKNKLTVLYFQQLIMRTVMTKSFVKDVQSEARSLGYTFPLERPAPESNKISTIGEISNKELKDYLKAVAKSELAAIGDMNSLNQQLDGFYANAIKGMSTSNSAANANHFKKTLSDVLQSYPGAPSLVASYFLLKLPRMLKDEFLSESDVARMVKEITNSVQMSWTMLEAIAKISEKIPALTKINKSFAAALVAKINNNQIKCAESF